jgi:hypothetical protein
MKKIFGKATRVSGLLISIENTPKRLCAVRNWGVRLEIPVNSDDSGGSNPLSLPTPTLVAALNCFMLFNVELLFEGPLRMNKTDTVSAVSAQVSNASYSSRVNLQWVRLIAILEMNVPYVPCHEVKISADQPRPLRARRYRIFTGLAPGVFILEGS